MKRTRSYLLIIATFLSLAGFFDGVGFAQAPKAEAVVLGSRTAREGFRNENEIAAKFDSWKTDQDSRTWLAMMNFKLGQIESVSAIKPHGEKSDVQIKVRTRDGEFSEGISIKLVSNDTGFNQIDKRRLAQYAKMWKVPPDIVEALKLFVGETKPSAPSRNTVRMYMNAFAPEMQKKIVAFFSANRAEIVDDLFRGDGQFAAAWFLVALKSEAKPRWVLRSTDDAAKFFGEGDVMITRNGNLRIGSITMQRKGGDGGRDTAKMLQFKINPALLFDYLPSVKGSQ